MIFDSKGILGINARNLLYIRPYNPKKAIKLADDKIKTKQFLSARNIPVPKLINTIRSNKDLDNFDFGSLPAQFVIKPNHGYGGEGIIPIISKKEGSWITAGGRKLNENDIRDHIQDILDGRFSISNVSDTAFFEQLIVSDEVLDKYSYEGLPDIRVVVHNLIPVMAMLRLPTKESKGKANLHLGAVGVGIDIAKGEATYIAYKKGIIDEIPDGKGKIRGLKIPYWDEILHIASNVQLITNLGYMAVDICLDKNSGPVLLEINARAGLQVQVANLAPLRKRLERIEGITVTTPQKGVRVAKDMFGNVVEKEVKHISGKQIISTKEEAEIIQKTGKHKVSCQINTAKNISVIDHDYAMKIGLLEGEDYDDEKSLLKLKFTIKNTRVQTIVEVEKFADKTHKLIVGSRDLKNFLVDTSITKDSKTINTLKTEEQKNTSNKINYRQTDHTLNVVDSKTKLLYHIRPMNIKDEKKKFFKKKGDYNPQFEYPQLKFDPIELVDRLSKVKLDSSDLGKIFSAKKKEIEQKIELLESIDQERFTEMSAKLYGKPSEQDYQNCIEVLEKHKEEKSEKKTKYYSTEEVKEKFEEVFKKYGLTNWKVKTKENMVAACVAGKNNRLFIREDVKFSEERIQSLIIHEIETHIITAENGKLQPYEIFNRGLAKYLETQEGMAMYNVATQMKIPFEQNYKAHGHVISIYSALTKSFKEVFATIKKYGLSDEDAFRSALKAKRGIADTSKPGAFTKDYIYYKGYHQVKNYLEHGKLSDLYIGKMNVKDVEIAKAIPSIREAKILPDWLKE